MEGKKKSNKNQKTKTVMWWSHHFCSTFCAISFLFLQNKTYDYTQSSQNFTLLNNVMLKIFSGKQIYIYILQPEMTRCNLYQCKPTFVILGYDSTRKKRAPVIRRPSDWNLIDKRLKGFSTPVQQEFPLERDEDQRLHRKPLKYTEESLLRSAQTENQSSKFWLPSPNFSHQDCSAMRIIQSVR